MGIITARTRRLPKSLPLEITPAINRLATRIDDETSDLRKVLAESRLDVYLLRDWYRLNLSQCTGFKRELIPLLDELGVLTFDRLEGAYNKVNTFSKQLLPDYVSSSDSYLFRKVSRTYGRKRVQNIWIGPFELDQYYETAAGGPLNLEVDGPCHKRETKNKKDNLRDEYLAECIGVKVLRPEDTPHNRILMIMKDLGNQRPIASRSIKRLRIRKFIETLATAEHNPLIKNLGREAGFRPQHLIADILNVNTLSLNKAREITWRWKGKYIQLAQRRWLDSDAGADSCSF